MKRKILIFAILISVTGGWASDRCDSLRVTYTDFNMGFTVRYHDDDWRRTKTSNYGVSFLSCGKDIQITPMTSLDSKNLTKEFLENEFKQWLEQQNDTQYLGCQEQKINDAEFYIFSASLLDHLQERVKYSCYSHSSDKGTVRFWVMQRHFDTHQAVQEKEIADFFKGFSLDGKACKGNPALRVAKDFMDNFR